MKRYFTFGFDHVDPDTGESLANKYVTIDGIEGYSDAGRTFMFALYGSKWSMEYTEERWDNGTVDGPAVLTEHAFYSLQHIRETGRGVTLEEQNDKCVCNVGAQECSVHPGKLLTKEEKIDFRKDWDAKVSLDKAQERGEI